MTFSDDEGGSVTASMDRWLPAPGQIMALVLLTGLTLRLIVAIRITPIYYDEIYQYLEPAYDLLTGGSVKTWEMRTGIRSWLLPFLLALPLALGKWISSDPAIYMPILRGSLSVLSLTMVGAAASLGMRISRLHGLVAGLVGAIWFELIDFAPRTLSDSIALSLLMGGVWLTSSNRQGTGRSVLAGLMFGLAVIARFQNAPLAAVLAIGWAGRDVRFRWLPLVVGGLVAVAIDAAIDLTMGRPPLLWLVKNIEINIVENRSLRYGVAPWWAYGAWMAEVWSSAALPIVALAVIGARRYPWLLAGALVQIALHSLIAHKEYRFILPGIALIIVLAAIGTADWIARSNLSEARRSLVVAVLGWLAMAAILPWTPAYGLLRKSIGSVETLPAAAGRRAAVCGLAATEAGPLPAPYVFYGRATPIFMFEGPDARASLWRYANAYNAIIAEPSRIAIPPAYRKSVCAAPGLEGEPCLFERPGACRGTIPARFEINRHLADVDR